MDRLLGRDVSSIEEDVATFTLFAARAMEKAGLKPIPVPRPSEHDPQWDLYLQFRKDAAREEGKEIDLSDAVPYGLGVTDRDAVDPCTRAWLEELRRAGAAFKLGEGSFSVGGQKVKAFYGEFQDVYKASFIYLKRRARDEIGARLCSGVGEREKTAAEGVPESSEQAARQLTSADGSLAPEQVVLDPKGDDEHGAEVAEGLGAESATLDNMATSRPATDENAVEGSADNRRGRRPNPERREAIRVAISKYGDQWRDHLPEILAELDGQAVDLGDFLGKRIDLDEGANTPVEKWEDLDLAEGAQRKRILDDLRKYR